MNTYKNNNETTAPACVSSHIVRSTLSKMTYRYKTGEIVLLNGDKRKLLDRRNEGRVCKRTRRLYVVEKMSNGNKNSYYEEDLLPISAQE